MNYYSDLLNAGLGCLTVFSPLILIGLATWGHQRFIKDN